MKLRNQLGRWLMPPAMLLACFTGWILLVWESFFFTLPGFCLTLANFLYPAHTIWQARNKVVITAATQKSRYMMLIIISALLTLSALDDFAQNWSLNWLPIKLTWLQILLIYLVTYLFPKVKLEDTGLEVGNRVPEFVFEDPQGNPVTRRNMSDGPILFYFFRGNWCPFCSAQIKLLMDDYKQIQNEGIHLAFVSSQPHDEMQQLAQEYGVDCDYLVDVNFDFSARYKLVHENSVPMPFTRYGSDSILPTLLLMDHHDKVLMLERTDNVVLRPEPEMVLERIKKLGKNAWLENLIQERTKELHIEKQKSEKIILNILPEHTAIELKENGKTQARHYECVSLLFSDFVGFTRVASTTTPQVLVDSLNAYFEAYDQAVEELGLEKIKTIGDAYMVASGLPIRDSEHAQKCCDLALRMLEIGERLKTENPKKGLCVFNVRIGIHSGPVMAGVVGKKKFSYDIWGDTVNLAARMESNSEQDRINISEMTYQLLGDSAQVESRGLLEVKNHQPQQMYFLTGLS